ncbi:MAG: hypothetical protein Q9192_000426 [Flavoplaca navasiana]
MSGASPNAPNRDKSRIQVSSDSPSIGIHSVPLPPRIVTSTAEVTVPKKHRDQSGPSPPRSLPPWIYHAHEVRDPVKPRDDESQWRPLVMQAKRMNGRDPPGLVRIPQSQMNAVQGNLDGPPKRPYLKKQPAPVLTMKDKARKLFIVDWWFPFALRVIQLICCIGATAMASNVLTYGNRTFDQNLAYILALTISGLAVLCLPVMIHFEFWDRPIVWRASKRFWQLVVDLVFIMVNSSTMAFAFYVVATAPPGHPAIRHRQLALAIMIVVALVAWVVTFIIHMLRCRLTVRPEYTNGSPSERAEATGGTGLEQ